MKKFLISVLVVLFISGTAFTKDPNAIAQSNPVPQPPMPENPPPRPEVDFSTIVKGAKLFRQNCAKCHGPLGQGVPNWHKPDANGKYLAPPLNGNGHTWHHSTKVLKRIINNGTGALGGNMPPWKDKLTDKEIDSILEWVRAQWPDNIYWAWVERNKQN